jgi:large subunit ribosomal protein L15
MQEKINAFSLQKIVRRPKKRLGRGHGSGKVKTSGRGTKGQRARGKIRLGFEGGQLPLIKRLPLLRGKDRNKSLSRKAFPISVDKLGTLPAGTTVTLETLVKYHMIDRAVTKVKILGGKTLAVKLSVAVPISASARKIIEKAGGSVSSHE